MKQKLTLLKVGGAIVEDEAQLQQLLANFAAIPGHKVLVHGGGRRATKVAAQLGIESHMVNGRRITDSEMLGVVTMVYGGLVNKRLVAQLQARGVNALGLTGADGQAIRSHRRPPVKMMVKVDDASTQTADGKSANGIMQEQTIDFGYVGDVEHVNADMLVTLIESGITPILSPLTYDGEGNLLNTNADTIAAETAKALASRYEVTLIYSFEKPA